MPAGKPSSVAEWLTVALAAVTGYVAWQVAPLTARMDAIERDQLATKDDLLAALENLARQVELLKRRTLPPATTQAAPQSETPTPSEASRQRQGPTSASQLAVAPQPSAGLEYFDRHLLPSDATIARMMVGKAPAPEIARATNHSVAFVLARGRQIEEMLATAHDVPPDLLRAIREYLKAERP